MSDGNVSHDNYRRNFKFDGTEFSIKMLSEELFMIGTKTGH